MHRLRSRLSSILCAASVAIGPLTAAAQDSTTSEAPSAADESSEAPSAEGPTADELSAEAVEAFSSKRYDEAVNLFNQAYDVDPQPNYLFNIGRVYEEKGDLESAVTYYQRFVSQAGVDIEARESATERLRVLRNALKQLEEDAEENTPEQEPQPPPPAVEANPAVDDDKPDRKRAQRIAGYSVMGVGGAALVVGAVLGGLASGKANDADDAEFVDDRLRLRDEARSRARAADAMYISGGVLAGVGLVLVLTTLRKKNKSNAKGRTGHQMAVAPAGGRRSVGLSLSGHF